MKAPAFDYARPGTLAEALALMGDDAREVAALAGGQSLMPMMNFRLAAPEALIDLGAITDLRGITEADGRVRIGAMTRYADIAAHPGLAEKLPLVAKALPHVAHPAIRNRGTLGGSVALADPAAEMPAVLLALGATIHLAGTSGERAVDAGDFFLGLYETAREPGELVTAIEIPAALPGQGFGFHELARRHGDYAMAGVTVARTPDPRIAFFAVSDRAIRANGAEAILAADPAAIDAAVAALDEIDFAGDLNGGPEMKRHLAGVVLRRAWAEASA